MTKEFVVIDPYLTGESAPAPLPEESVRPELVASGKRDSIQEAFEDTLWALGGVHYLTRLGKQNPLEFTKLLSKFGQPVNQGQDRPPMTLIMTLQDKADIMQNTKVPPAPVIIEHKPTEDDE